MATRGREWRERQRAAEAAARQAMEATAKQVATGPAPFTAGVPPGTRWSFTRAASAVEIEEAPIATDTPCGPEAATVLTESEVEARTRPLSYFIGRGVVTQQEMDAHATSHYRWVEASINMVFPTLAVAGAVLASGERARAWWPVVVPVALGLAWTFAAIGRRKMVDYKERVVQHVAGKLDHLKEANRLREQMKDVHDVLKLAKDILDEREQKTKLRDALSDALDAEGKKPEAEE